MSIIKSGTTTTTAYSVDANTNGDLVFIVSESLTAMSITAAGAVSLPTSSLTITSGATLNGGVVVNEPGADVDFRVEGDTDANLLFVDASADAVGIGTNTPGGKLTVSTSSGVAQVISNSDATNGFGLKITAGGSATARYALHVLDSTDTTSYFKISTETGQVGNVTIPNGNLGLGVTPSAWSTAYKAFQLNGNAALSAFTTGIGQTNLSHNLYRETSNWKFLGNDAASLYAQTSGIHYWYNTASGTAGGNATLIQAMTLTADNRGLLTVGPNGSVGSLGTGVATIGVWNTSGGGYRIYRGTGSGIASAYFYGDENQVILAAQENVPLIFHTNGTERARITAGGEVFINTTATMGSGSNKLEIFVSNAVNDSGILIKHQDATGATAVYAQKFLNSSGSEVGSIKVSSTATSFNQSSDRRMKENISSADDAGLIIDAIEIVKHDWKSGGHTRYGVVAQDLHAIAPEAVSEGDDGEEVERAWGVDYSKLVPMLVKEIQSLRARVAALEAK